MRSACNSAWPIANTQKILAIIIIFPEELYQPFLSNLLELKRIISFQKMLIALNANKILKKCIAMR